MAGEWTGKSSGAVIAGLVGSALGAGPVIFYSLPLLMRPVTQEFHWSLADFSVVQGIASITVAIVSPFLGYLTDRWGARAIMLPGILAFGIANFLLSQLNGSLTELYLFWFLIGLSAAFVGPVAYSKLISAWFYRRRGLALGVSIGIGGGIGGALMPLVVGPIILNHGWRMAYWTMSGAIIVICLPVAYFLLQEPAGWKERERQAKPTDTVGMTAAEARKTRNFWLLAIAQFLGAIAVLGRARAFRQSADRPRLRAVDRHRGPVGRGVELDLRPRDLRVFPRPDQFAARVADLFRGAAGRGVAAAIWRRAVDGHTRRHRSGLRPRRRDRDRVLFH